MARAGDDQHRVSTNDAEDCKDVFKLLVIGDSGVGKSCLVTRFTRNFYSPDHVNTIGVDFRIQKIQIDGNEVTLQIWDSAGYERFRIMTSSYYRGAHGIIMVYDVTNKDSFRHLNNWHKEIQLYAPETAKIVVVGNKCDLISDRTVSSLLAESFSRDYNIRHLEVSARTAEKVDELFFTLSSAIARKRKHSQSWTDKSLVPHTRKELVDSNSFEIYEMIRKVEPMRPRARTTTVTQPQGRRQRNATITSEVSKLSLKTGCCCIMI